MNIILKALSEAKFELAARLIELALPYQVCQADENGMTPLHLCVIENRLELTKLLLAKGADVNAKANYKLNRGMTPLHFSALKGHVSITKTLITWGANVHIQNGEQETPANVAYQNAHIEVAKVIDSRFNVINGHFPRNSLNAAHYYTNIHPLAKRLLELQRFDHSVTEAKLWLENKNTSKSNVIDMGNYRRKISKT